MNFGCPKTPFFPWEMSNRLGTSKRDHRPMTSWTSVDLLSLRFQFWLLLCVLWTVQWFYLTVRSKWRFWRWFDFFGGKFACWNTKKKILEDFYYEFRLRIHILHTIKNDNKIVSYTLKNEYFNIVVCPSQNLIVKSTGSFYNQKLFEHCGNSVFTGLQSGNYSSLINN